MPKQWTPKLEETLSLSKNIISGAVNISFYEMDLSLNKAIEQPTIRTVFKDHSNIGYSVVKILVNRFIESFGFSTKLSEMQLETLTVDTLEKFSYDSLDDIMLFFKMARNGSLGTTKRGVDSNLIYGEWFPKYMELKSQAREEKHIQEKKNESNNSISIEDVKKSYEKIKPNNSFRDRVLIYIDKITEGITRQQLEDLIQEWSQDEQKKEYLRELKIKRLTIK